MKLEGKCVVVTGAAGGIGAALARRFAAEGARAVVVADREPNGIEAVAREISAAASCDALALVCDVTKESDLQTLVDTTEERFGPIDLFCSNAGVISLGGPDAPDADWQLSLDVNVMAHVYAARILVPMMLERGGGYLLQTASAAGLLTQLGSAPYSVTKHAALALAEWLSITYGDQGIKVSVLAPQAVRTAMTAGVVDGGVAGVDGMLEPDAVADAVVAGLDAESFLILPHPQVLEYFRRKASDYERWLRGMRRLQSQFGGAGEPT
jgi:NAD(P)-dependent dehydrogenase (short-subunit alcohol dehydrogenase family)